MGFGWKARLIALMAACLAAATPSARAQTPTRVDSDGTLQVPSFTLPESALLGPESRAGLKAVRVLAEATAAATAKCGRQEDLATDRAAAFRACWAQAYYQAPGYRRLLARYPVTIREERVAGVRVEIYEPVGGVAPRNRGRLLINLHGGGFLGGFGPGSRVESLPVAALGRFRVMSIDYRHAPEFRFPAASEDVAAVYRAILKKYRPGKVGIFGCSAGGLLTAEAMAWFQHVGLPSPGAIGMFSAGGDYWASGDSGIIGSAIAGAAVTTPSTHPYFGPAAIADPLAFPFRSDEALSRFPPSLMISASRDLALSATIATHARLVRLGRRSDLHVWEGMPHCFQTAGALPEAADANRLIARFFNENLGLR